MVKHTYPDQRGLIAVVVPPCDSMDTCLSPVGRPLQKEDMKDVLCEYAPQIGRQYIQESFGNECVVWFTYPISYVNGS